MATKRKATKKRPSRASEAARAARRELDEWLLSLAAELNLDEKGLSLSDPATAVWIVREADRRLAQTRQRWERLARAVYGREVPIGDVRAEAELVEATRRELKRLDRKAKGTRTVADDLHSEVEVLRNIVLTAMGKDQRLRLRTPLVIAGDDLGPPAYKVDGLAPVHGEGQS